ncbi:MAG: hypothetical protein ACFFFH_10720 [Candidatus Thorarchaeota archaeon]
MRFLKIIRYIQRMTITAVVMFIMFTILMNIIIGLVAGAVTAGGIVILGKRLWSMHNFLLLLKGYRTFPSFLFISTEES